MQYLTWFFDSHRLFSGFDRFCRHFDNSPVRTFSQMPKKSFYSIHEAFRSAHINVYVSTLESISLFSSGRVLHCQTSTNTLFHYFFHKSVGHTSAPAHSQFVTSRGSICWNLKAILSVAHILNANPASPNGFKFSFSLFYFFVCCSTFLWRIVTASVVTAPPHTTHNKKQCSRQLCGVTWEPLTYCPWAILQTSRSKFWFGAGPKLKYLTTAWHTRGWVLGKPCFEASISSFHAMFCLRKVSKSSSSVEMLCALEAILERKEKNLEGSCDHPMGGGMLGNYQQNCDVLLCIYSLSNVYN